MSLDLIHYLNKQGMRVFTIDDVYKSASELGLQKSYIPVLLSNLAKSGAVHHLIKGKYSLDNNLLSGTPLHEFEVANFLSENSAIGYLSAFSFHNLTDQIPLRVYSISFSLGINARSHFNSYNINNHEYVIVKTCAKSKWGIEVNFINETQFYVTDLERTLLDGLEKPRYCMGIREVLNAFELAVDRINIDKICDYAIDYGSIALQKRLGFILEKTGLNHAVIERLRAIPVKVYQKLDIHGERRGKFYKEWMIIENI